MPLELLQHSSGACTIRALKAPMAVAIAVAILFRRILVHVGEIWIVLGIHVGVGGLLTFDSGVVVHVAKGKNNQGV